MGQPACLGCGRGTGQRLARCTGLWEQLNFLLLKDAENLTGVSCLTGLEALRLENIRSVDLSKLEALPKLIKVGFESTDIELSVLATAANWTELTIRGPAKISLKGLSAYTGLSLLVVENFADADSATLSLTAAFSALSALTRVTLSRIPFVDVSVLASASQLRTLTLADTNVVDIGALTTMSALESVSLVDSPLNDVSLDEHVPSLIAAGVCVEWNDVKGELRQEPDFCFSPK